VIKTGIELKNKKKIAKDIMRIIDLYRKFIDIPVLKGRSADYYSLDEWIYNFSIEEVIVIRTTIKKQVKNLSLCQKSSPLHNASQHYKDHLLKNERLLVSKNGRENEEYIREIFEISSSKKRDLISSIRSIVENLNVTLVEGFDDLDLRNYAAEDFLIDLPETELEVLKEILLEMEKKIYIGFSSFDEENLEDHNQTGNHSTNETIKKSNDNMDLISINRYDLDIVQNESSQIDLPKSELEELVIEQEDNKELFTSDDVKDEENTKDDSDIKVTKLKEKQISNQKRDRISIIRSIVEDLDINHIEGFAHLDFRNYAAEDFLIDSPESELETLESIFLEMEQQRFLVPNDTDGEDYSEQISTQKRDLISVIRSIVEDLDISHIEGFPHLDFRNYAAEDFLIDSPESELETLKELFLEMEQLRGLGFSSEDEEISFLRESIFLMVEGHDIQSVCGFNLPFATLLPSHLEILTIEELRVLYARIRITFDNSISIRDQIDPLEILNRYKFSEFKLQETSTNPEPEHWREDIPKWLHKLIPKWSTDPIEEVYNQIKKIKNSPDTSGSKLEELIALLSDLSQIVFAEDPTEVQEENIREGNDEENEIAIRELILHRVEMVILPHLEVKDRLVETNGMVTFKDIWRVPFNDSIKEKVKNRDKWKCVICESPTELHVHHKIPRIYGGVHHMDNLVTLCASCHGAVETARVEYAYMKGCENYFKARTMKPIKKQTDERDIKVTKEDVFKGLDLLTNELIKTKDEALVSLVNHISRQLDILFNDEQ